MVKTALPSLVFLSLAVALAWAQGAPEQPSPDLLAAYDRELAAAAEAPDGGASPAVRANLPLAHLALKKARLLNAGGMFWFGEKPPVDRVLEPGRAALRRLREKQPCPVKAGELNELAYLTANDRTCQPYYLYLPPDYTPEKQWPLIVFLHGYVPSISVLDPWVLPPEICDIAGANGCMLLIPYGRRNTDFQGVGEVDVFAALREVQALFPVDADRLYLSGCSMGGMGVWNIALRHPGVFAAATPLCGHTDMFLWCRWPREETVPWKRWLVEWDNAVDQALNLTNQQVFAQHGELDNLVPAEQSRLMVKAAEAVGAPLKYFEWPGGSHFIYLEKGPYEKAWSWQKQFTLNRRPRTVKFRLYSLEYNRAHWLTVDDLAAWGQPAEIEAAADPQGGTLKISSRNVTGVSVDALAAGFGDGQEVKVTWERHSGQDPTGEWKLKAGRQPWTLGRVTGPLGPQGPEPDRAPRKRHGLCGPVEEAFDGPFIVVQGTAGDQAADEDLARKVARWAQEWDDFADGRPVVKTDTEITAQDYAQNNLICFGTPETNAVVARLAGRLPVTIGDHRYVINGQEYAGGDLGLVMCYPTGFSRHTYAVIYAGEYYGEQLSINHKHDLIPDFLVFTTQRFGRDQANEPLCAGFFDMDWKLDEKLIWGPAR